nr:BatD family protein [Lysobacter segetis]
MSRATRWLLVVVLCLFAGVAGAQTRAWLDRDRIALGETTTLNIETDANAAPDYAPLLADFDLSGQASRRQLSWSNGSVSASSLYAVALRPKRDGLLRIPALRVGGRVTLPLTLLVTAAPAASDPGNGDVFIQSEADAQDPYVQQTVGWTVRLYSAVPLIAGELDQPEPTGASLQRIGDDVQYRRTLGSRSYVVTERRFLLIPERSGELVIPPARFEGRGTGNALDQLFGDGQEALHAVARPRVLTVRPIPANAPQPWLPLRALSMRYLASPAQAQVGRAVDVVVEVVADGATASQLPELTLPAADGVQVFPERAQSDETMAEGRPHVRLQRRFSIVPTRAGRWAIPGPRIDWWDSRAGAARTATLPPITLQVAPGAMPAAAAEVPAAAPEDAHPPATASRTMLAMTAGIALLLIAVGLAWRVRQRGGTPRAVEPPPFTVPAATTAASPTTYARADTAPVHDAAAPIPAMSPTPAAAPPRCPDPVRTLARALEAGDLGEIELALRALAGDASAGLDAVMARLDDEAQREAVDALQRARWAGGDPALARSRLRTAFARGPRWRAPPAAHRDPLPPLYPGA